MDFWKYIARNLHSMLVADVILDTTMKMMIPIYLKKADTETNMKFFFVCFMENILYLLLNPKKMGFSWLTTRRQQMGERVVSCLEYSK